jgi:hypothetical protein
MGPTSTVWETIYSGSSHWSGRVLSKLSHDTADADSVFDEIDLYTGIGQIERRLNAGDSRTHYHLQHQLFRYLSTPDYTSLFCIKELKNFILMPRR